MTGPTVHAEQLTRIYARSVTPRYANRIMSSVWSQDPGPDNPLAAPTAAAEARRPEEAFVAPISSAADAFVPILRGHRVDLFA
ncbi:MAG: hypothetical protein ACOCW6_10645 [Spirochaetota bacterium]